MGEARRRRGLEAEAARYADELAAEARAEFLRIEELASEDPDDRAMRLAHGFTAEDDWRDLAVLCRNGCGLSYFDVVAGKIRACAA